MNNQKSGCNWDDESTEKLRRLWAEGLSARKIAVQIPGATRNSVIGKAHRLGLPARAKSTRKPPPPRSPAAARRRA